MICIHKMNIYKDSVDTEIYFCVPMYILLSIFLGSDPRGHSRVPHHGSKDHGRREHG